MLTSALSHNSRFIPELRARPHHWVCFEDIAGDLSVVELMLGFGWALVKFIFHWESVFEGVESNLPQLRQ